MCPFGLTHGKKSIQRGKWESCGSVIFIEHRLRSDECRREKADHILAKPARKGLVTEVSQWPYVFFPNPLQTPPDASARRPYLNSYRFFWVAISCS
jgi:hypothetical protein